MIRDSIQEKSIARLSGLSAPLKWLRHAEQVSLKVWHHGLPVSIWIFIPIQKGVCFSQLREEICQRSLSP